MTMVNVELKAFGLVRNYYQYDNLPHMSMLLLSNIMCLIIIIVINFHAFNRMPSFLTIISIHKLKNILSLRTIPTTALSLCLIDCDAHRHEKELV